MDFRNLFQNHSQKNAETEQKSDLQNHAANNNRRFFYMVEDRFALKNTTVGSHGDNQSQKTLLFELPVQNHKNVQLNVDLDRTMQYRRRRSRYAHLG